MAGAVVCVGVTLITHSCHQRLLSFSRSVSGKLPVCASYQRYQGSHARKLSLRFSKCLWCLLYIIQPASLRKLTRVSVLSSPLLPHTWLYLSLRATWLQITHINIMYYLLGFTVSCNRKCAHDLISVLMEFPFFKTVNFSYMQRNILATVDEVQISFDLGWSIFKSSNKWMSSNKSREMNKAPQNVCKKRDTKQQVEI